MDFEIILKSFLQSKNAFFDLEEKLDYDQRNKLYNIWKSKYSNTIDYKVGVTKVVLSKTPFQNVSQDRICSMENIPQKQYLYIKKIIKNFMSSCQEKQTLLLNSFERLILYKIANEEEFKNKIFLQQGTAKIQLYLK
jgi:hypothetical protein